MTNPNDPAFPGPQVGPDDGWKALTKREYFAAMAMQGLCSNTAFVDNCAKVARSDPKSLAEILTSFSLTTADQLIVELSKEPSK